jgi:hypothetical protein
MTQSRRKPRGRATSDLIVSAMVGDNDELFAKLMKLHVEPGTLVADVTYGKGVFWKRIEPGTYDVLASDVQLKVAAAKRSPLVTYHDGVDCRALPYGFATIGCVVLDPPYMEGFFRREQKQRAGSGTHASFLDSYAHDGTHDAGAGGPKYHEVVFELYRSAGLEASRVLCRGGKLIVKCQDEVSSNTQRLTHIEIVTAFEAMGFYCKDLFILMRMNKPGVSRVEKQEHARKNHSYFLVFELPKGRRRRPWSSRG